MTSLLNGSLPQGVAGIPADAAAQGARRATADAASAATAPDPEVSATAKRRQFSSAEKRRILSAADHCKKPGELGALLRKEGIYSSMLANWRKQRTRGDIAAATPKRGRKPDPTLATVRRNQQLERENDRLRRRLAQAQEIIEVQKKLCNLLGLPTAQAPPETD